MGFLDDAAKTATRFYMNNFADKTRQEAIDLLLGKVVRTSPLLRRSFVHEFVHRELLNRYFYICDYFRISEYSSSQTANIIIGTWNVNGKFSTLENIDSWIMLNSAKNPHMYVIGIQELIELSPGAVRYFEIY